MGALSFWYFWTIQARKKLINLILKKGKISGEAQYGSISADWIFRVVNFGFHYLRHFSINFENSWAHLAANFLNFSKHPKHFLFGWFLWKLWMKNQKCWRSENMPILAKGSDVTFQSAIYPSSQVLFGVLIELIFIFWAIFLESKRLLKVFWA